MHSAKALVAMKDSSSEVLMLARQSFPYDQFQVKYDARVYLHDLASESDGNSQTGP
jgi:hypothetical protein